MASKSTASARKRFLEVFARCGNIKESCDIANIGRHTHYDWLEDPEYRKAFEDAKEDACDVLAEEVRRRGQHGYEELQYRRDAEGNTVGEVLVTRKYDSTLLMFLLKSRKPEVYRDNVKSDVSFTGSMAVSHDPDLDKLTHEQLQLLRQLILTAGSGHSAALAESVEAGSGGSGDSEEAAE